MLIVYGLFDPETLAVHYVGLSVNPTTRASLCLSGCSTRKARWLTDLKKRGLKPGIRVLEDNVPESSGSDREIYWVSKLLREGEPLTNVTPGGGRRTPGGRLMIGAISLPSVLHYRIRAASEENFVPVSWLIHKCIEASLDDVLRRFEMTLPADTADSHADAVGDEDDDAEIVFRVDHTE